MKLDLVPRGSGKKGPSRYDMVLMEPFAGFPVGTVMGQWYNNEEGKRQPNPNRQILALKMVQFLEGMKR